MELACGCLKLGKGGEQGEQGDRSEVLLSFLLSHAMTVPFLTDSLILTDDSETHSLSLLTYIAHSLTKCMICVSWLSGSLFTRPLVESSEHSASEHGVTERKLNHLYYQQADVYMFLF